MRFFFSFLSWLRRDLGCINNSTFSRRVILTAAAAMNCDNDYYMQKCTYERVFGIYVQQ